MRIKLSSGNCPHSNLVSAMMIPFSSASVAPRSLQHDAPFEQLFGNVTPYLSNHLVKADILVMTTFQPWSLA